MKPPVHADGRPMVRRHGYWWPNGGEVYGERYVRHAHDLQRAVDMLSRGRRRRAFQAGGHVGAWPIWLSLRFNHVTTVEPEADNFAALNANLNAWAITNVDRHHAAIGARAGTANLKVNQKNIGGHKLNSKLEGQPVTIRTIDELMGGYPVDLIALDVEGYEYAALLGGLAVIQEHKPVIMLEDREHAKRHPGMGDFRDIVALLKPIGYLEAARIAKDVIFKCAS